MDFSDPEQRRIFFEIHAGLPRQSAGSDGSTSRALDLVSDRLPPVPNIADMACGPGTSALVLAEALPTATLWAIDLHQPFLDELAQRIAAKDMKDRIVPICADMIAPLPDAAPFDMIWCEGGIYNVGVREGLMAWRHSLRSGGIVVFNEPVWLVPEASRAREVAEFWRGYPEMTDRQGVERAILNAGYRLIGGFDLFEADWWNAYYHPLEERLDDLKVRYVNNPDARGPFSHTRTEIDIRRRFAAAYNYRFFAAQLA
jgi:SAM-dependent methyltransferase